MKRKYITPQATAFAIHTEGMMAASLKIGDDTTVDSRDEILSNKRENPIWGESNSGMWDSMK